ncbi:hypothetical protein [Hoylesella oralis]|uniref:hypothetical protein n=1 Tax=Hoylesella oralis TaxID=28134 RepID=UPI0028EA77BF|nr:hypothetical protein [Hoylesella oralis]
MVTTVVEDKAAFAVETYQMQATIMETFIVDLQKIGGKNKIRLLNLAHKAKIDIIFITNERFA